MDLFQSSLNVRLGSTARLPADGVCSLSGALLSGDGFQKTPKNGCSCTVNCMKLPQLSGLSQLSLSLLGQG